MSRNASSPSARRYRSTALALSLALVAVSGCECEEVVNQIPAPLARLSYQSQEAPPAPQLEIAIAPTLIATTATVTFSIHNDGDAPLDVTNVVLTSDPDLCPTPSAAYTIELPAADLAGVRATTIDAGGESAVTVAFTPPTGAPACTVVEVQSNDETNASLRAVITGQGDAPQLCTDTAIIDFGDVFLGATATDTIRLESCGTRPITITEFVQNEFFPPFALDLPTTPAVLNPGETIEIPASFSPTVVQSHALTAGTAGVVDVQTDAAGQQYQIALEGNARREPSCQLTVVPNVMQFGQVASGRNSTQFLIVRNAGERDCTVDSISLVNQVASFSVDLSAVTLPLTMVPLDTVQVPVTFAPAAAAGTENDIIAIESDDPVNARIEVPIEGNSVEATPCLLEASPTAINFGNQATGRLVEQVVTLTNVGTETCSLRETDLVSGAPDFSVQSSPFPLIGTPIPDGDSTDIIVSYRPQSPGAHSGLVRLVFKEFGFGNPDQTLDIPLTGQGLAPELCVTPSSIDFGDVAVGATASESALATNCGPVSFTIRGLQLRAGTHPDFAFGALPPVPVELLPGEQISIPVDASPTQANIDTAGAAMYGTVEILSEDPDIPAFPIALRANAPQCQSGLQCSPTEIDFGIVDVGSTLVRSMVCNNPGTAPVSPTPTFTSGGTELSILAGPATVAPQQSGIFIVQFSPSATGPIAGSIDMGATDCSGNPVHIGLAGEGTEVFLPPCPNPQAFTPRSIWRWDGTGSAQPSSNQVWHTPLVSRLEDTDGDGRLTRDDLPRVVFISYATSDSSAVLGSNSINDPVPGVLRALDGATGAEVWSVTNPDHRLHSAVTPAIADIDGDGRVEIVAQQYVLLEGIEGLAGEKIKGKFRAGRLMAFEHDGTFKWLSDEWSRSEEEIEDAGGISIGDMNNDGFPEIAVGDQVFDHNGHILWRGGEGTGSTGHGPISVILDLDGQPGMELVTGRSAYRADGTTLWSRSDLDSNVLGVEAMFDGHVAVSDVDNDGTNDVVVRGSRLYVFDGLTGATKAGPWLPPVLASQSGECDPNDFDEESDDDCNPIPTHPALADIDGDGDVDISLANKNVLLAYDGSLNELWRADISDQTGAAGPTAFDFENDGFINVVFADEGSLYAYDFQGSVIYDAPRSSVTLTETPAIADIDNDGHANMVIPSNEPQFGIANGVEAYENNGISWPHARGIWNQHAYVESIIGELGTPIPSVAGMPALRGFRTATPQCVP